MYPVEKVNDDCYLMTIPTFYLPRDERRMFRDQFGEIIDIVFSDYGELYIRIWKTISNFMAENNCDTLEVKMYLANSHGKEMISNICYGQFDVVKCDSSDEFIDIIIRTKNE